MTDFTETAFPDHAGWYLQIGSELHAAAMGGILLLVNEKNTAVATAFRNAAKPRPIDRVVLSAVFADVAHTMMEHALVNEEFVDGATFEEDSLGATLMSLFRQWFGDASITDARLRLQRSPGLFASDMQDAVKIFEGV